MSVVVALLVGLVLLPFAFPGLTQPQTQYLAGVMVLGAGLLAFFGTHLTRVATEKNDLREHHREMEISLRNRFSAIATQLSDSKSGVRQAGAYALAALANDWDRHGGQVGDRALGEAERQVCINILCAYLRGSAFEQKRGETEVRRTVVDLIRTFTLVGERKRPSWSGHLLKLSEADLKGAMLDHAGLSGADLEGANLAGSRLVRADLSKAYLAGATLVGANLTGANLQKADLSGADLSKANLAAVDLTEAIWTADTTWPQGYRPEDF